MSVATIKPNYLKIMRLYILVFALIIVSYYSHGQGYKENQTVQVIVHKIIIPEGGTLNEALSLTQEWTENVLRKNENFDSIQLLISDTSKDTIDLMVLYTYKEETTRDTNEINQELIKRNWPEDGDFEKFISRLHKYINPRLNERSIYKELVKE